MKRQHASQDGRGEPSKKVAKVLPRKSPRGVPKIQTKYWPETPPAAPISASARDKWIRLSQKARKIMYQHSPIKDSQVRLLFVNTFDRPEDKIVVSLKTVEFSELLDVYEYEALSYHWGAGDADLEVYVRESFDVGTLKSFSDAVIHGMKRIFVKPNLYQALQNLRRKDGEVILWVDAICIDQENEEEKQRQVARMAQIYNKAVRVCIWLGQGDQNARSAMKFIDNIVDPLGLEANIRKKELKDEWKNLIKLMRSSWFSRRWVIQELALAREATVHCAGEVVHWDDFRDAISLFLDKFDMIQELFSAEEKVEEIEAFGARILVDVTSNIFRKNLDGTIFERRASLEELVCNLASFEASDPRDTIYALLNLAREIPDPYMPSKTPIIPKIAPPVPDYARKNLLHVYMDFIRWVVHQSGRLDVICRPWAIPERDERGFHYPSLVVLPSYIKDVSLAPFGRKEEVFRGRKNGDSLVGQPGFPCYDACYRRRAEIWFAEDLLPPHATPQTHEQRTPMAGNFSTQGQPIGIGLGLDSTLAPTIRVTDTTEDYFSSQAFRPGNRSRVNSNLSVQSSPWPKPVETKIRFVRDPSLWVKGFILDTIVWAAEPTADGIIFKSCLERGGWHGFSGTTLSNAPDKLWRTMVADRGPDGKSPPSWYHRACLHCLVNCTNNGHLNTKELLANKAQPEIVKRFLKRVQAVTWNRVFFETTERSGEARSSTLFGIGPETTKDGDVIAILFGCSVPVVLRRHERLPEDGDGNYELIGECYVYGKMDGEAVSSLSDDELREIEQDFRLM